MSKSNKIATYSDLIIEKHPVSGGWEVSCRHLTLPWEHRLKARAMVYNGYTKREALKAFYKHING